MRFGHIVFNLFLSCLIRETFTNPEPLARYTAHDQVGFFAAFAEEIVLPIIYGVEVYYPIKEQATTREELMLSFRYRTP